MKETKNWLPKAEKEAQGVLSAMRFQIRTIDRFRVFDKDTDLLNDRKRLSEEIRSIRYYLKGERYKAVLRGDLSPEKYRPKPARKSREEMEILPNDTISEIISDNQPELLLVS